ncbi:MAG TPA: YicC/YloC family endoribonuclease [Casimicrobiaceae bacterium]
MILSMTGFAAVGADLPGVSLSVELRSVNHRYLDLQVRLPDELRGLESSLRERIGVELRRGKVECRISLNRTTPGAATLAVDTTRVEQLAKAAADVERHAPGAAPLSIAEILRWPGVLAEPTVPPEALAARVQDLVGKALSDLAASRAREGTRLAQTLAERCAAIEIQVARVTPRIPLLHSAYVDKLGARLREAGLDPDQDRLKQELALFATKIDVAEEVERLTTHVAEVRRVLAAGGSAGKRLDFLMQELHREANTLGSKSVDAELSQASLELKVLIEQMREQVQNLE